MEDAIAVAERVGAGFVVITEAARAEAEDLTGIAQTGAAEADTTDAVRGCCHCLVTGFQVGRAVCPS